MLQSTVIRAALIASGLAVALQHAGAASLQEKVPVYRSGVNLVSLSVTVVDVNARHVTDLNPSDFTITENGVPQQLKFFAKTDVPLAIALLLDTSGSMDQTLKTAQDAAVGLVRQLGSRDLAAVVDFDSSVKIAQSLTGDRIALETAIRQTSSGGATALYNAVYIALREMAKVPIEDRASARRRAIILLSDGDDTSSLVNFDDVLDLATRLDTVVYTIGLGSHERDVPPRGQRPGVFVLRRLALQTGGQAFFPRHVGELAAVYRTIREELNNQYSLAYESSSTAGDASWRSIAVRVGRPGVAVRARQGYRALRK